MVASSAPPMDALEIVRDYHRRTRHHLDRYAPGPGYMDWASQPDPFLTFPGVEGIPLPIPESCAVPLLDDVAEGRGAGPAPRLDPGSLSTLLYHSLALAAWKEVPGARWALRVNPSSGNLHPTEAYLVAPRLPGIGGAAAVYHYQAREHSLERLRDLPEALAGELFPPGCAAEFLVVLASIPWREAWKYGERAYRYCHLDVGHAIAALAYGSALVGRRVELVPEADPRVLSDWLGLAVPEGPEPETADVLLAVGTGERPASGLGVVVGGMPAGGTRWTRVVPRPLSPSHRAWPAIDRVREATEVALRVTGGERAEIAGSREDGNRSGPPRPVALSRLVRQRRSAVAMDGVARISRAGFERIVGRLGNPGRAPLSAFPLLPRVHPVFFVHRVDGMEPGLWMLVRRTGAQPELAARMDPGFAWEDAGSGLRRLSSGDLRGVAKTASCRQDIASDGVFAVAMVAEVETALAEEGPAAWRRLHWEAGMLGQVLYLEAEAAGIQGTGIGCFFDEVTHQALGIRDESLRVVYHFAVGRGVEDRRLRTLPAYPERD